MLHTINFQFIGYSLDLLDNKEIVLTIKQTILLVIIKTKNTIHNSSDSTMSIIPGISNIQ